MSMNTWVRDYYPIPVQAYVENGTILFNRESMVGAAVHSLRKWRGLRKVNMDAHGVHVVESSRMCGMVLCAGKNVSDGLAINCDTCHLCKLATVHAEYLYCDLCPLRLVERSSDGSRPLRCCKDSAFEQFALFKDPERMIKVLEKAVDLLRSMDDGEFVKTFTVPPH